MKEVFDEQYAESDASSRATIDYSSGCDERQYSSDYPRRFSLSDARFALSYVKRKMKQQEITFDEDDGCKILAKMKQRRRGSKQCSSFTSAQTFSTLSSESSNSRSGSLKTYSSFPRPERKVIYHEMELLKNDGKNTFNIFSSNVDFVEHSASISRIQDAPAETVSSDNDNGHNTRCSSKVMFPLFPPRKPPPLQIHAAATPKYISYPCSESLTFHHNDDDVSNVTHVENAN